MRITKASEADRKTAAVDVLQFLLLPAFAEMHDH
jgi:hypothetical protein